MHILLTGGGTGGHIFPLVAVARELKNAAAAQGTAIELFYVGPDSEGLLKKAASDEASLASVLRREGIQSRRILAGKLRRYASALTILDIPKFCLGFFQVLWHLFWIMPDAIFAKGGYGSVAVGIVGWLYRIPMLTHESDAVPGLANKILKRFAKRIAISFARAAQWFPKEKTALVGNPIRTNYLNVSQQEARRLYGVSEGYVIFVIGGSQGAQFLNERILEILSELLTGGVTVIHQAGALQIQEVQREAAMYLARVMPERQKRYLLYPFLDEGQYFYALAASDLVISRAGAGGIFEIAAMGKPSILVPITHAAGDHQRHNAYDYAETGGAEVLEEANLTPNLFYSTIKRLLDDPQRRATMSASAKTFAKPEAGRIIAEALIKLAA